LVHGSNWNSQCACGRGTETDGSTFLSAVSVGYEMAGKSLAVCEQDFTAAVDDSAASPGE